MRILTCLAIFLCATVAACSTTAAPPPPSHPPQRDADTPCAQVDASSPICRLDAADVTEAMAQRALGAEPFAMVREGNRMTLYARSAHDDATVCCGVQGQMSRIGATDLWVLRYRMADLDRATLGFIPPVWLAEGRNFKLEEIPYWRGPNAPPTPPVKAEVQGQRLERTLWSESLHETRRLYIYLPPNHRPGQSYPAIFMADGANAAVQAGLIESMIDRGLIPPIVLVGAQSGQEGIVEDRSSLGIDLRAADYLPGFTNGGDRFEEHLRFFSEELVAYAVREFGVTTDPAQRAVEGFSNGGSFALYAALRHPDVFGVSIALSPGWEPLSDADFAAPTRARFFMSAGLYEIGRGRTARGYADALRAHGYNVDFQTPATGHFRDQEDLMLAQFVPQAFAGAER